MRPCRLVLVLLICLLQAGAAAIAVGQPRELDIAVFEDPAGRHTIDQIRALSKGSFKRLPGGRLAGGLSKSTWWLRLRLPSQFAVPQVLDVASAVLDHADLFLVRDGRLIRREDSGESVAYNRRPYPERRIAFRLAVTDAGSMVYIRLRADGFVTAEPRLQSEAAFLQSRADQAIVDGFFFGALGFVVIFNFFLYFGFRDRVFLAYAALMTALMGFTAKLHGYLDQFVWPGSADLANPATATLALLAVIAPTYFVRNFLQLPSRQPLLNYAYLGLMLAAAAVIVAQPLLAFGQVILTAALLGLVGVGLWLTSMIRAMFQGYTPAIYLFAGQLFIAPATIALMLRANGTLPSNLLTLNVLELSLIGEAIFISLGLSSRVALLRREKRAVEATLESERASTAERLVRAQEEEKQRVAADLHDSVGQSLLVVVNRLGRLAKGEPKPDAVAEVATDARGILDEVRNLSRELHPNQVLRVGLASSLTDLSKRLFADTGIEATVRLDPEIDTALEPEVKVHIFRTLQAALVNCLRHAQASSVQTMANRLNGSFEFVVADDGVGFGDASTAPGLGLRTMTERMGLIGAEIDFSSRPNGGALVRLIVPANG